MVKHNEFRKGDVHSLNSSLLTPLRELL
jgi:hypothetical protein